MFNRSQQFFATLLLTTTCIILIDCGLNELCDQIDYYEKRDWINCLRYDDYGCWCGPGGSGPPVDGADTCCRGHDHCYDRILANGTCNPYIAQYHFKDGKCLDEPGTCLNDLCMCDQTISKCLSTQPYHWWFYGWRPFHKC